MSELLYKDESYLLIGICMEVHRYLGVGFKEAVYKDALELEFLYNSIPFSKETKFLIEYKGVNLKHNYRADFIVFDCIFWK